MNGPDKNVRETPSDVNNLLYKPFYSHNCYFLSFLRMPHTFLGLKHLQGLPLNRVFLFLIRMPLNLAELKYEKFLMRKSEWQQTVHAEVGEDCSKQPANQTTEGTHMTQPGCQLKTNQTTRCDIWRKK